MKPAFFICFILIALLSACTDNNSAKDLAPEITTSEKAAGGIYTSINTLSNAYDMPAAYLSDEQRKQYHLGRRLFQHPQFNCQQCHYNNGRSTANAQGLFNKQLQSPKSWVWRYQSFIYPDGQKLRLRTPLKPHTYQLAPKLYGLSLLAKASNTAEPDFHPQLQTKLSQANLTAIRLYSFASAVPSPRAVESASFKQGRELFYRLQCQSCHQPSHKIRMAAISDKEVEIWPYSDLQRHDLGPELANAEQSLWPTAALWGLGFTNKVNSQAGLLHDGRARTYEEAILWHGGEAKASRQAFVELDKAQRRQLLDFLHLL